MQGFKAAWQNEAAFRQEVVLGCGLIPAAFFVAQTHIECLLLVASVLWVWLAELVNSALEAVVDRIGSQPHPLSGRAKDIGSALVFVSLMLLVFVWGVIICHRWAGFWV